MRSIFAEADSKDKYYPYRALNEIAEQSDASAICDDLREQYGDNLKEDDMECDLIS